MKKLPLHTPSYEYLENGFREWLDILGYAPTGVYNMPNQLREFLYFLEQNGVVHITALEQKHIKNYHRYLSSRPNYRRGGGLSERYILMHIRGIEKFLEYLHHRGIEHLPVSGVRLTAPQRKEITVLSVAEIQELFAAAEKDYHYPQATPLYAVQEALQSRDKAMLAVYYGCGLRRSEGEQLQVEDVQLDRGLLHVRKGKGYKERFVPFNKINARFLEAYIYDHRPALLRGKSSTAVFVAVTGRPMSGKALYYRLKFLQLLSEDMNLQQKEIGLHTLRHSIATHLLQGGMSLEKIARFLGHSTMDSTQIYTHLIEQNETAC